MTEFLKKELDGNLFELLIDSTIFLPDIILRAAYNFLDRGYFFFKLDVDGNTILRFTPKDGAIESSEAIIGAYSDELLNVYLRDKLEKENKTIRETIVNAAIANSLDIQGFVSIDTENQYGHENDNWIVNMIDFDKDIDEILREIENDPELKIDEAEIERILKEIEEETRSEILSEPKIIIDPNKVQDAKKKFQSRS